jgi:hypothetical protein
MVMNILKLRVATRVRVLKRIGSANDRLDRVPEPVQAMLNLSDRIFVESSHLDKDGSAAATGVAGAEVEDRGARLLHAWITSGQCRIQHYSSGSFFFFSPRGIIRPTTVLTFCQKPHPKGRMV